MSRIAAVPDSDSGISASRVGSSPPGPSRPWDFCSLSLVVPIHNEQENLWELHSRINDVLNQLPQVEAEILLVSDGSTDNSDRMISEIVAGDARYKGIFLSRNFGHQAAVSIGLEQTVGEVVAIIDGDLQDPPHELPRLLDALAGGADVAYGIRTRRKERWWKRAAYSAFYRLLRSIADIDIPLDSGDFCCMRRRVVTAMLRLPERNRFVRGLRAWVGFRQVGVAYERSARHAGTPSYSLTKLLDLAYNGMFSFSALPIRIAQTLGIMICLFAITIAIAYVALYLMYPALLPPGFATLAISLWLLAGVQLFFLGVLGEYIVRTFDEVRRRPIALIRQIVNHNDLVVRGPQAVDEALDRLSRLIECGES